MSDSVTVLREYKKQLQTPDGKINIYPYTLADSVYIQTLTSSDSPLTDAQKDYSHTVEYKLNELSTRLDEAQFDNLYANHLQVKQSIKLATTSNNSWVRSINTQSTIDNVSAANAVNVERFLVLNDSNEVSYAPVNSVIHSLDARTEDVALDANQQPILNDGHTIPVQGTYLRLDGSTVMVGQLLLNSDALSDDSDGRSALPKAYFDNKIEELTESLLQSIISQVGSELSNIIFVGPEEPMASQIKYNSSIWIDTRPDSGVMRYWDASNSIWKSVPVAWT